jgi:hypothetical protein
MQPGLHKSRARLRWSRAVATCGRFRTASLTTHRQKRCPAGQDAYAHGDGPSHGVKYDPAERAIKDHGNLARS